MSTTPLIGLAGPAVVQDVATRLLAALSLERPHFVMQSVYDDAEARAIRRAGGEVWQLVGPLAPGETLRLPSQALIDRTIDCTGEADNTHARLEAALERACNRIEVEHAPCAT